MINETNVRKDKEPFVNKQIKANRLVLIDEEGKKLGEFLRYDALKVAEEKGLDLVEVSPGEKPICKLMDYGKFKYQQSKAEKEKNKKQTIIKLKELKMRPNIDEHDFQVRLNQAKQFLKDGNKVKLSMRFRGREHAHINVGEAKCKEFAKALEEVAIVESPLKMNGSDMHMVLTKKG